MEAYKALSVRQPWAELILCGEKTVEYRSQLTKIRGRIYIYASLTKPDLSEQEIKQEVGCSWNELPKGVIVGTVEIVDCLGSDGDYEWILANPQRLNEPIKPTAQPQPVWFNPFGEGVQEFPDEPTEDAREGTANALSQPVSDAIGGTLTDEPCTAYHAKLFAHELLRRSPSDSVEKFTAAIMESQVDLNPHQVDAALFAFRSPLSNGAILADEVGLGKTIEAGIVLSQKWAEGKRRILIILPSSLRKQWHQELQDKFYLPSQVLEAASFNKAVKAGKRNPFDLPDIVLCSYQFARNKASYVKAIQWDLVVIDEAHRLRNVYKTDNRIARSLKESLAHAPKLLLTATPLQNSLLELYGLVSFIDEHTFGDLKSFRTQFARLTPGDSFDDLKQRLSLVCKRTLRRQVLEYIRYTERKAHTQEFIPSADEQRLYELVSAYLQRGDLHALPSSQRALMTLVLRKLLASSTFAIAGALESLTQKLRRSLQENRSRRKPPADLEEDFESFDELADELEIPDEDNEQPLSPEERAAIEAEIGELEQFFELAMQISHNSKGTSLFSGLQIGFRMAVERGGAEKAIIFTESRRTQNYLLQLLADHGYGDQIVLFNGTNSDAKSRQIYAAWKKRYAGTDKVTGSSTADTRAALVDHFREHAKIMIATEAAAEGINLQFCSLVVNYDLPWNPQRIEQRIGRCHRYGQKHDVVVVNFLNKNNAADQRVYELLSEKFQLFDGVFGASDEVLGSIESGVDFEKRIAEIYQTCRTTTDIQASFDALQEELKASIDESMKNTRTTLLENFDAEVAEKLRVYKEQSAASLSRYESLLWDVTQSILAGHATFYPADLTFELHQAPPTHQHVNIDVGVYTLPRRDEVGHHYRLHHPLAQHVLETAASADLPPVEMVFDYTGTKRNIAVLEELVGKSGSLAIHRFTITSLDSEDHFLFAAVTDTGETLTPEQTRRLFNLPATINAQATSGSPRPAAQTASLTAGSPRPASDASSLTSGSPRPASDASSLTSGSPRPAAGRGAGGEGLTAREKPIAFFERPPSSTLDLNLPALQKILDQLKASIFSDVTERNSQFFDEEMEKLNRWAADKRASLKSQLKDYDDEIAELKKQARTARNLPEKLAMQKKLRNLDKKRDEAWKEYDEAAKGIERQKDDLIDRVEARLQQSLQEQTLFTVRWKLI